MKKPDLYKMFLAHLHDVGCQSKRLSPLYRSHMCELHNDWDKAMLWLCDSVSFYTIQLLCS
uniref:Uncharacterized protein n=1 Tax=Anguilla anguilla TaxID=7936 RepID=A0A0E9VJ02_ANGAN